MLFTLSYLALATPRPQLLACTVYQGRTARLDYTRPTCLDVIDCLFKNQEDFWGGALYCSAADLSVTSTTFVGCSAWDLLTITYGGAICHDGGSADITRCCFLEDTSLDYGNAITFGCAKPGRVNDCSFVRCKDESSTSRGGIYTEVKPDFTLTRLNFSDCRSTNRNSWGVVLYSDKDAGSWTFSECTVVRCYSGSGIDHQSATVPKVSTSGFYNNSFAPDDALLSANRFGFDVSSSIFSGNTRELCIVSSSPSQKFSVSNCVFSGLLPPGNFYKMTTDNQLQTQTASFPFVYYGTQYCPNASPTKSPIESPAASPAKSATQSPKTTPERPAVPSVAATPTDSPPPSATAAFSPSDTFAKTAFLAGTNSQIQSRAPALSTVFAVSKDANPSGLADTNSHLKSRAAQLSAVFVGSKDVNPSGLADTVLRLRSAAFGRSSQPDFSAVYPSLIYPESGAVANSRGLFGSESRDTSGTFGGTKGFTVAASNTPRSTAVVVPATDRPSASLTAASEGGSTLKGPASVPIVVGSVLGVILVVLAVAFALYRSRSSHRSFSTSHVEMGLSAPTNVEFRASGAAWDTLLGGSTENPVAATVDPFGFDTDEH
jgi:hypothetical protein